MPRTGENIYKRKDNRWEGRYIKGHKPSGKPIYGYVYAYSYKEVKAKLNLAISGKDTAARPGISSPTFSELAEQWLKSQKTRVKESTYNKYENNLRLYILPHIGDICLKDLSLACVTEMCDTLLSSGGRNGKGLSEKTVADTIVVLRSVIRHALNMGNTCSIDVHAVHVRQPARELHILSQTDLQILYSYLHENPSHPSMRLKHENTQRLSSLFAVK